MNKIWKVRYSKYYKSGSLKSYVRDSNYLIKKKNTKSLPL